MNKVFASNGDLPQCNAIMNLNGQSKAETLLKDWFKI